MISEEGRFTRGWRAETNSRPVASSPNMLEAAKLIRTLLFILLEFAMRIDCRLSNSS